MLAARLALYEMPARVCRDLLNLRFSGMMLGPPVGGEHAAAEFGHAAVNSVDSQVQLIMNQ